jgi:F-type H+-transporting ATPase subunit b
MHLLAFAETIQLFPDGSLFIHIGLLLFMIWLLNRTLYKPLNRVFEARERSKGGHSSEAEALLKDVDEKEARYNRELLDARSQGYELIEKEQKKAAAARDKKLKEARAEAAEKLGSSKAEIEQEAASARKTLAGDAEKLADRIAEGILKN